MKIKADPSEPRWACRNCIMMLANGQTPVDMEENDEQFWWENYIAFLEIQDEPPSLGMLYQYHECGKADNPDMQDQECDCEHRTYSTRPCAICGSEYAGERDAVTFWSIPDIYSIIYVDGGENKLSDNHRQILAKAALDGNETARVYLLKLFNS